MKAGKIHVCSLAALLLSVTVGCSDSASKEVVRPEEIKSRRLVVYDQPTYAKLASQWREYNDAYPSEYAYANWIRAADYAGDSSYAELLDHGLKKYPANPTLLYLKALQHAGTHNDLEARARLKRAAELDPDFVDPWFVLVTHYMDARDENELDAALQHILESGAIADEVMDYSYNMIAALEPDAILITNGDNDTFPGWILTRIVKFRPDVTIVNRSLLNTDWYPFYVIERGLPRFVESDQLDSLREAVMASVRKGAREFSPFIFSDSLIARIVDASATAGRPVYLAKTMPMSAALDSLTSEDSDLGLVRRVTPAAAPYREQVEKTYRFWVDNFRTAGLSSWKLQYSDPSDAGRRLVVNYAEALATNLNTIKQVAPELLIPLFDWYNRYVADLVPQEEKGKIAKAWCGQSEIPQIRAWCRKQGISE